MMNRITVFVCEAEPASVAGVRWLLAETEEFELIGTASSLATATPHIAERKPQIVLTDHASGMRSTIHFLSELRYASERTAPVMWIRDVPEAELVRAFQAGARGFVRKSSPLPLLLDAFRQVHRGETYLEESASLSLRQWTMRRHLPRLTPREREIIDLVSKGMKNREIAAQLNITPGTVKVHLMHVFEKTGAGDRYELAVRGDRILLESEPEFAVRKSA